MKHPFFQGLSPTLHISHRGGAALAPENTLVAFQQAVERYRTDMLELDVHLTRDGELVVAHDPTLERCTNGEGAIADFTYSDLARLDAGYRFTSDGVSFPFRGKGAQIPRLIEVLRAFPQLRMNIELKASSSEAVQAFTGLIRAEKAVARVCLGSAEDEVAGRIYEALPEGCHFYPFLAGAQLIMSLQTGEEPVLDERYLVLDVPLYYEGMRVFSEELRDSLTRLDRWINVWTVDDPAEMRRLVQERVGGIMTDRPDLLREVLGG